MKTNILIISFLCSFSAFSQTAFLKQSKGNNDVFAQNTTANLPKEYGIMYAYNDSLQYETYPTANGWGYRLYVRYRMLVNQPMIPALAKNVPFANENDAKKIAKLASSKVAKGFMPPTLELKEIKKVLKMK